VVVVPVVVVEDGDRVGESEGYIVGGIDGASDGLKVVGNPVGDDSLGSAVGD